MQLLYDGAVIKKSACSKLSAPAADVVKFS